MEALWRGQLADGLSRLGISLAEAQVDLLVRYLALLEKWNRVFNLTAVRDSGEMVERHLMDSLSVLPHIKGSRLLDVGSGAGLPGIPLAVACPDLYVELIDSISKKARFLNQVRLELGMSNLRVVHGRVERYRPDEGFDTVISRAFASVGEFWRSANHLLEPGGIMLAMKARSPAAQLDDAAFDDGVDCMIIPLPRLLGAERHLVRLRRVRD